MGLPAGRLVSGLRPWETLSSELVLDEPWYRVRRDTVRLPDGRVLYRSELQCSAWIRYS